MTWETRADMNWGKGGHRANGSGTAVGVEGQGVRIYQELLEFLPTANS